MVLALEPTPCWTGRRASVGERDASYEASSLAPVDLTSLDRLSEQTFTPRRRGVKIFASRVSIRPETRQGPRQGLFLSTSCLDETCLALLVERFARRKRADGAARQPLRAQPRGLNGRSPAPASSLP
jgi:hypothetical protein